MDDLLAVPDDVLSVVFTRLISIDPEAVVVISTVSRRFLQITLNDHENLWRVATQSCDCKGNIPQNTSARHWYLHHCRYVRLWKQNYSITTLKGHQAGIITVHVPQPRKFYSFNSGPQTFDERTIVSVSTTPENSIKVWNQHPNGDWNLRSTAQLSHLFKNWAAVSFSNSFPICAVAQEKSVIIYDLMTSAPAGVFTDALSTVTCVQMVDNLVVFGGYDKVVRVHNATNFLTIRTFTEHKGTIWSVCLDINLGIVLSGDEGGIVYVHDLWNGNLKFTLEGHTDSTISIHIMKNHPIIVTTSYDHSVRLWDIQSGALLHTLNGHTDIVLAASSFANMIVSGGRDGVIRIWDCQTGNCVSTLEASTRDIKSIKMCSDKIIVGSYDCQVRVYQLHSTNIQTVEEERQKTSCSVM
eukprot:c17833_g1_i2.p1 GENE.c17833_g1_i2~~c17833_g1_i2.p1  ORF type:complete len:411 (+),score=156.49 c17833_g1_i2:34-1266(+)